jgi:hypothetical protein
VRERERDRLTCFTRLANRFIWLQVTWWAGGEDASVVGWAYMDLEDSLSRPRVINEPMIKIRFRCVSVIRLYYPSQQTK